LRMAGAGYKRLWRMAICALVALCFGCKGGWPWDGRLTDDVPGITPPWQRIAALKLLAKDGPKSGPEREETAARVAGMYAGEPDPLIRLEVVRTLGAFPGPAAAEALRGAAKDSDSDVRVAVCQAIAKHRDAVASEVLRERLAADTDLDVRLAAAEALGELRDPASIQALGTALEDRNPAMQYRAVCSLRKVAPNDLGNDVDRWRQYAKDGTIAPPKPVSLAERLHLNF
jgi:HEAT repeat protein